MKKAGRWSLMVDIQVGLLTSDVSLIDTLLDKGYVPVISPIALGEEFEFLNVDGDRREHMLQEQSKLDKIILLTNVDGLILEGESITNITSDQVKAVLPQIGFGMEKKVLHALSNRDGSKGGHNSIR